MEVEEYCDEDREDESFKEEEEDNAEEESFDEVDESSEDEDDSLEKYMCRKFKTF